MKILLQALRRVSDAHESMETDLKFVTFSTIVNTDFGEDRVEIKLGGGAEIKLINDFGIEKVNTKTSMSISASLTDVNRAKLLSIINGRKVSLEMR